MPHIDVEKFREHLTMEKNKIIPVCMTVCRDKKIETSLYALNQTGHRVAV